MHVSHRSTLVPCVQRFDTIYHDSHKYWSGVAFDSRFNKATYYYESHRATRIYTYTHTHTHTWIGVYRWKRRLKDSWQASVQAFAINSPMLTSTAGHRPPLKFPASLRNLLSNLQAFQSISADFDNVRAVCVYVWTGYLFSPRFSLPSRRWHVRNCAYVKNGSPLLEGSKRE